MSIGRRDQVCKLYRYQAGGSGGFMASDYVPILTPGGSALWWCRLVDRAEQEETFGEKARQVQEAVIALAWEASPDPRGLFRVQGVTYRITGIYEKRQAMERHVTGVWAEENSFAVES